MKEPSSQYLTHMHPTWKGCNIVEIALISILYVLFDVLLAFVLHMFYGNFMAFLLVLFIATVTVFIKYTCHFFGKYKLNKPPGVVNLQLMSLMKYVGLKQKHLTRVGIWSTGRR